MKLDTPDALRAELHDELRGAALAFALLIGHVNRAGILAGKAHAAGVEGVPAMIPACVRMWSFGPALDAMLREVVDIGLITREEGNRALAGEI